MVKLPDNKIVLQRVKPATLHMQLKSTYKNVYDLSVKLQKDGYEYLGMILIGEICRDASKNSKIKKSLKDSGYVKKYKEYVQTV